MYLLDSIITVRGVLTPVFRMALRIVVFGIVLLGIIESMVHDQRFIRLEDLMKVADDPLRLLHDVSLKGDRDQY